MDGRKENHVGNSSQTPANMSEEEMKTRRRRTHMLDCMKTYPKQYGEKAGEEDDWDDALLSI